MLVDGNPCTWLYDVTGDTVFFWPILSTSMSLIIFDFIHLVFLILWQLKKSIQSPLMLFVKSKW